MKYFENLQVARVSEVQWIIMMRKIKIDDMRMIWIG
jgi:hypothetical protein